MIQQNTRIDDVTILRLAGRLDVHQLETVAPILAAETAREQPKVVVNMFGISFIDADGLSLLEQYHQQCQAQDGEFYLCQTGNLVRIILELTRKSDTFTVFDSELSALGAMAKTVH